MQELINKVVKWGQDRGLDKVGHEAQARYTLKETAELLDAYADKDIDAINDAIGDILVTLIVGASNDTSCRQATVRTLTDERITFSREPSFYNDPFSVCYPRVVYGALYLLHRSVGGRLTSGDYGSCISVLSAVLGSVNHEFNQQLSLQDCLQLAYNEIKNRTGKLVNGQFIKDN